MHTNFNVYAAPLMFFLAASSGVCAAEDAITAVRGVEDWDARLRHGTVQPTTLRGPCRWLAVHVLFPLPFAVHDRRKPRCASCHFGTIISCRDQRTVSSVTRCMAWYSFVSKKNGNTSDTMVHVVSPCT
jgi:hypothetical protein